MQITILGSGTCVPSAERTAACISIAAESTTVLLDSGPGSLHQMRKAGISSNDVDLLCYTHLHIDHTADFIPLLFASKYAPQKRIRDLAVLADPEFENHYSRLINAYGQWIVPDAYTIKWLQPTRPIAFGPLTITCSPVQHTPHSIAFRVHERNGACVVYSGDTDYCSSLVELARNCDLLILECSFPEGKHTQGHLTPSLAGRIAAEASCKQVVLTHFYPECDPQECCRIAAQYFKGEITEGKDQLKIIK